jgi:hypothetical protein
MDEAVAPMTDEHDAAVIGADGLVENRFTVDHNSLSASFFLVAEGYDCCTRPQSFAEIVRSRQPYVPRTPGTFMKNRDLLDRGTILVLTVIFAVFAVIFGAFVQNFSPAAQGYGYGQGPGGENAAAYGQGGNSPVLLPMTDTGPLTHEEMADIMFMREEEQLAHDLYIRWAALYPLPVFSNIAGSETMHIYEVQLLMDRYGLPNNQTGDATVGYHSPVIQSLYDSLGPQATLATAALEAGLLGKSGYRGPR